MLPPARSPFFRVETDALRIAFILQLLCAPGVTLLLRSILF
jgi:hypothetical protein